MCNQQTCGGDDYCCSSDDCTTQGGPRPCTETLAPTTPVPTPSTSMPTPITPVPTPSTPAPPGTPAPTTSSPTTPSPTLPCPWRTPSGQNNLLVCRDGTMCDVSVSGWSCCAGQGGRSQCPVSKPTMCNQ